MKYRGVRGVSECTKTTLVAHHSRHTSAFLGPTHYSGRVLKLHFDRFHLSTRLFVVVVACQSKLFFGFACVRLKPFWATDP